MARRYSLVLLLILLPWRLQCQVYSLDSCVAMALRGNKEVQAAHHTAERYAYSGQSLRANYFPKITFQAADLYSSVNSTTTIDIATPVGQFAALRAHDMLPYLVSENLQQRIANYLTTQLEPLNPDVSFRAGNLFNASLTLEQPLYTGGKVSTGNRMGRLGAEMAQMGERLSREEVTVAVYEGYQLLVKAQEMVEVARQYDSLLTRLTSDVESAVRHGMATRNDMLKVQVKKNDAELSVRQAENGLRLARMNLCQLVGLPLTTPMEAVDNDGATDVRLEATASPEQRTEYRLLELKSQLAEQKIRLERAEALPQLGLLLQGGVLDGMELMDQKMFQHQVYGNIAAVLTVPLFHAGETRNKIRAAREEYEAERLNMEDLQEKLNLDLQQQANLVDEALLELSLRQRNVDQCAENLRVSRKAYDMGMEPLSGLLEAQLLWQQANAQLAEARYQLKINLMKWRKAAGRLGSNEY